MRDALSFRAKAEALLFFITLIWGCTFVVVKGALADAPPLPFVAARFTLAGLLLLLFLARGRLSRQSLLPGVLLGLCLFVGYAFQTTGLVSTTASKSAFITGFSVVLVPLWLLAGGARLRRASLMGAGLALVGLYLVVSPSGGARVNRGDVLTLIGAVAFALYIVLVGVYAPRISFTEFVPVQILTVGLVASATLPLLPAMHFHWTGGLVAALLVTAVFATAFAFSAQNWAQKYTLPSHAAIIFALEPAFAAATSRVVFGERLGPKALVGSGLILAAMLVSEIWGGGGPAPIEG